MVAKGGEDVHVLNLAHIKFSDSLPPKKESAGVNVPADILRSFQVFKFQVFNNKPIFSRQHKKGALLWSTPLACFCCILCY